MSKTGCIFPRPLMWNFKLIQSELSCVQGLLLLWLLTVHHRLQIPLVMTCAQGGGWINIGFFSMSASTLALGHPYLLYLREGLFPHSCNSLKRAAPFLNMCQPDDDNSGILGDSNNVSDLGNHCAPESHELSRLSQSFCTSRKFRRFIFFYFLSILNGFFQEYLKCLLPFFPQYKTVVPQGRQGKGIREKGMLPFHSTPASMALPFTSCKHGLQGMLSEDSPHYFCMQVHGKVSGKVREKSPYICSPGGSVFFPLLTHIQILLTYAGFYQFVNKFS